MTNTNYKFNLFLINLHLYVNYFRCVCQAKIVIPSIIHKRKASITASFSFIIFWVFYGNLMQSNAFKAKRDIHQVIKLRLQYHLYCLLIHQLSIIYINSIGFLYAFVKCIIIKINCFYFKELTGLIAFTY